MEMRIGQGQPIEHLLLAFYPLTPQFFFKLHLSLTFADQDPPQAGHLGRRHLHQLLSIDFVFLGALPHALREDGMLLHLLEKGRELLLALHK